jgi:hypothetical protein
MTGDWPTWELSLMFAYRGMALAIALIMISFMLTERSWRTQLFAAMVFVPFVLRAFGVK